MIALVILIVAYAFASGYISRGIVARAGSLPPATRRAIRRDRAQRIADISRARHTPGPTAADLDAGQERMLDAVAKLGDHYEPPAGWQDRAISSARWRPCATCGLPLSEAHNARVMPAVGLVCIPCGTGKERPRG